MIYLQSIAEGTSRCSFIVELLPLVMMLMLGTTKQQHVHYVIPSDSQPQDCPHQPCLSINQYMERADMYFTTRATFLFLAGNYSLQATTIHLVNISDVTLAGKEDESDAIIHYGNSNGILCENMTNFQIQKLTFVLNASNVAPAILVIRSKNILIFNSIFKGGEISKKVKSYGPLIIKQFSDVTIVNCLFKRSIATYGALMVLGRSNITLDGNFIR